MAGEQHRRAICGPAGQQPGHGLHGNRIQAGKRLVQHQQVRFVHQRGDQLNPLLVTVRQGVQAVRRPFGQAETLQPGVHAASGAETGGTARVFARATPEQKPSIIAGRHIFADVVGRTIEQVADPVNAGARGVGLLAASRSASSPSTRYQRTLRQPLRRIHRALPAQPQGLRPPQPRTYQHAGNIRQKGPASGRRILTRPARDIRSRRPVSGGVHDGDLRLWARPPKRATLIVGICLGRST